MNGVLGAAECVRGFGGIEHDSDGDSADVSRNKNRNGVWSSPGIETSSSLVDDIANRTRTKKLSFCAFNAVMMFAHRLGDLDRPTDLPTSQINAHRCQFLLMNGQQRHLNRWMTRGNF